MEMTEETEADRGTTSEQKSWQEEYKRICLVKIEENVGLRTIDALQKLKQLSCEFLSSQQRQRRVTPKQRVRNFFRKLLLPSIGKTCSRNGDVKTIAGCFDWFAILFTLLLIICAVILHYTSRNDDEKNWIKVSILLAFLLIINCSISICQKALKNREFENRLKHIIQLISVVMENCNTNRDEPSEWLEMEEAGLLAPNSPSVTQQWTIRDGRLMNLPTILLVPGDVILLRPGQQAPARLVPLEVNEEEFAAESLEANELFCPYHLHKVPLKADQECFYYYIVQQAPFLTELSKVHDNWARRPVPLYDRAAHLLYNRYLHRLVFPSIMLLLMIVAVIRSYAVMVSDGEQKNFTSILPSSEPVTKILQNILSLMHGGTFALLVTVLSPVFPVFYSLADSMANASLLTMLSHDQRRMEDKSNRWWQRKVGLVGRGRNRCLQMMRLLMEMARGTGSIISHSTNLVQAMASVMTVCCVDKKGVLSWPNPSAEKIFFLTDRPSTEPVQKQAVFESADIVAGYVEILDIRTEGGIGGSWCKVDFEERDWIRYVENMKPLGLAILLNTCNLLTHPVYTHFCDYITTLALHHRHLVPVANRRCLCELAHRIGFKESAVERYQLLSQFCSYKRLEERQSMAIAAKTDSRLMQTLMKRTKKPPQFPFPHAFSALLSMSQSQYATSKYCSNLSRRRRTCSNFKGSSSTVTKSSDDSVHLFSQGTADIILDLAIDYWDGAQVRPLTPLLRKRILDFYQRSSLTGYCTAFAYKPIVERYQMPSSASSSPSSASSMGPMRRQTPLSPPVFYVQLAATPGGYSPMASSSPTQQSSPEDDESKGHLSIPVNKNLNNFASDRHLETLNKQVFIGMVSMQYQPLSSMVCLIEELEKACIRFVHFSKENELRSRVFSEKMGLESGWNCHISLLSASAPPIPNIWPSEDHYCKKQSSSLSSGSADKTECEQKCTSGTAEASVDCGGASSSGGDGADECMPFTFDISNRAKLPQGIENVKPHLEQVDNVPLLVSLFTDCTSNTTKEMVAIMQQYGQIVCLLGSAANLVNLSLFAQADASISVEPLYPQLCQKVGKTRENIRIGHLELEQRKLSHSLVSFACSLSISGGGQAAAPFVYSIIAYSRITMNKMWNCVQLWICAIALIATIQLASGLIFQLPPLFNLEDSMWLNCLFVPWLCCSLAIGRHLVDSDVSTLSALQAYVMSKPGTVIAATDNAPNVHRTPLFDYQVMFEQAVSCYGAKLALAFTFVCLNFIYSLFMLCQHLEQNKNETKHDSCYFYIYPPSVSISGDTADTLRLFQLSNCLLISLHLVAICLSFVYREASVLNGCGRGQADTQRQSHAFAESTDNSPDERSVVLAFWPHVKCFRFLQTFALAVIPIIIQLLRVGQKNDCWFGALIPLHSSMKCRSLVEAIVFSVLLFLFSPILTFIVCEFVKIREIRIKERYEKKVRLEFGTKLGMNSPF